MVVLQATYRVAQLTLEQICPAYEQAGQNLLLALQLTIAQTNSEPGIKNRLLVSREGACSDGSDHYTGRRSTTSFNPVACFDMPY